MFDHIKPESGRELSLLSRIKNQDIYKIQNKAQSTTNKISNNKSKSLKNFQIYSNEKYINNCYFPKHYQTNSNIIKRNISSFPAASNADICGNQCKNMQNHVDVRDYKPSYSKIFYNDKFLNDRYNYIFRNTNSSRIRKIYSMSSDIFNLNGSSPNCTNEKISSFYNQKKINYLRNEYNYAPIKKLNKSLNKIKRNKSKENTNNNKPAVSNNPKQLLKDKLQIFIDDANSRKFNRSSYLLRKDYNKSDIKPLLTMKNKSNLSNISSVNYNIITTDINPNINDQYLKYSNIKPEFTNYESYEIIIPRNFNNTSESKLQNILHSEGLHYFDFQLDGDIVVGEKGKYTFNIRKSNLDNDKNNTNKIIKKLEEKYNIKLEKTHKENKKKASEITKKYRLEKICNHLQQENNTCKYGKKNNRFINDLKYKNEYLYKNEKAKKKQTHSRKK